MRRLPSTPPGRELAQAARLVEALLGAKHHPRAQAGLGRALQRQGEDPREVLVDLRTERVLVAHAVGVQDALAQHLDGRLEVGAGSRPVAEGGVAREPEDPAVQPAHDGRQERDVGHPVQVPELRPGARAGGPDGAPGAV